MTTQPDFRHVSGVHRQQDAARFGSGRRAERSFLSARIASREQGRKANAAALCDVSTTGCHITTYWYPSVGQRIWIMIPGLESVAATVRWVSAPDCGCEFDSPLHPAVLANVLERLKNDS